METQTDYEKLVERLMVQVGTWRGEFMALGASAHESERLIERMDCADRVSEIVCQVAKEKAERCERPATQYASEGVRRINAERLGHFKREGWTPEHDDTYTDEQLANAAAAYACPATERVMNVLGKAPLGWPWESEWWKPGDRVRELEKSGALIAAEIDRLLRRERQ